jgi:hypothetical protein
LTSSKLRELQVELTVAAVVVAREKGKGKGKGKEAGGRVTMGAMAAARKHTSMARCGTQF